jgi:hypothetical protein
MLGLTPPHCRDVEKLPVMAIVKLQGSPLLAPHHPHCIASRKCPFNTLERQVDDLGLTVKFDVSIFEVGVDEMANLTGTS